MTEFQQPTPVGNIAGNYFNKHTSRNIGVRFVMKQFYRDFSGMLGEAGVRDVLDVGCGEGYMTQCLKEMACVSIRGVDVEQEAVDIARQTHADLIFDVGDIYHLDFADASFDCVAASEVLEHLEYPEKALEEMKRVTRKYCLLSVPHEPFFRIANIVRFRYLSKWGNTPGHIQNWARKGFVNMLKRNFKEVKVKGSTIWTICLCTK